MKIGDKVRFRLSEPDGNVIQGMGNIHHIDSEAIIPIQVELNDEKLLGQKLCRFYATEVELVANEVKVTKKIEVEPIKEPEPEEQAPLVEPKPPVNMVVRMVQKISGYSFNPGDVFAASETTTGKETHCYIYDPYSFKQRGCVPKKYFEILYNNVTPDIISRKAAIMDFVKKSVEKRETAAAIAEQIVKDVEVVEKKKARKGIKKSKTVFEVLESKGQMNIFDFEEVKV